jgi:hypothetical protein
MSATAVNARASLVRKAFQLEYVTVGWSDRLDRSDRLVAELPARIGPAEYTALGGMIAVRCPSDLEPLMRKAGRPVGAWRPALADPAAADRAAHPQTAKCHRSAVPAGRGRSGRGG